MPEGDTIHRLARALQPILVGVELDKVRLRELGWLPQMAGREIARVEALGKHLLLNIDNGWVFRAHLGMYGDVHLYRKGERWKQPEMAGVLTLVTRVREVVWFEPAQVELLRAAHLSVHPILSQLGPDLLAPTLDLDQVRARLRKGERQRTIGELLLDQRVACGIGNIYKNEVLFLSRINPWMRVAELGEERALGLYQLARKLLLANLGPGPRSTRMGLGPGRRHLPGEPLLWAYGREHQPCLRCGAAIEAALQGDGARITFFCPGCQGGSHHL